MKIINVWTKPASIMAAVAISTSGIGLPAAAQSQTETSPTSAPAPESLIGQCRAVNKPTPIYTKPLATSPSLGTLATNSKVTLADNGNGAGFIGISKPLKGFVQSVNLKPCPPAPPANACRRVIYPPVGGINIRREPNITSELLGGIPYLGKLYLTTVPATTKTDASNRVWVEIAKPINGWVSNGFKGGNSNLGYCP
ncbi:MAG: hypothetical protein WCA35_19520 [Kovacikia sp.]